MGKHTEGPWELSDIGDYADFDGQSQIIIADDRRLAAIHVSDDETKANARLIAAAPELLGACLFALGCIDGTERDYKDTLPRILKNAIAKAEGREE